ncbi:MAG TPA: hypothetical protein PKZ78_00530 [Candidatus Goldiibacteriota bacterium]|nr:hypothetical protein [Candidatus Goldiibacteriota bacterium]
MTYTLIKLAFKVSDMANKASSDYLMSLCKCATFHYDADIVLVMAFVEEGADTSILKEYPMIEINWNKYVDIVTTAELGLKYMNGDIERPIMAVK